MIYMSSEKMLLNVISIVLILKPYFSLGFTADQITQPLPGLAKQPTFKQYSGYLNATKGRYYHYWFVESQSNPLTDPVVLWLTGGPGGSSLMAFWSENGPFRVQSDSKTVTEDPHSWNTIANVLYLESPVGVGYSYIDYNDMSIADIINSKLLNNDDSTAEDNYLALKSFFKKFPQFSKNPFYITGESYAGIYIPMLAVKIYENNSTINLKGLGIGNGAFDFNILSNSMVRMAYTHGLIGSDEWHQLVRDCCSCHNGQEQICEFSQGRTPGKCNALDLILNITETNGINPYNMYSDCNPMEYYSTDERFSNTRYYLDLNTYFGVDFDDMKDLSQYYSTKPNCLRPSFEKYMNDPALREALHIPDVAPSWVQAMNVNYTQQYTSMRTQVKQLIEKYKIPTFIAYNGDLDLMCDFMGDQQFVDELGLKLKQDYRKWTVNGRVAGFVKRYEGITFMTVRNAGHMVPTDQPEAALHIFKELIGISKVN